MNNIEAEVPFFFKGETSFTITLDDETLKKKDSFLRIELYPKLSPLPELRHYGFWDIDMDQLQGNEFQLSLDWENRELLFCDDSSKSIRARGISYDFDEHGYAMMHISVWESNDNGNPVSISTSWHIIYLEHRVGDSSPILKQINIPVTDQCNLSCIMCPRHKAGDFEAVYCDDAVVQKLVDEFPNLTTVLLQGMGEPMLYPGLADIIRKFRAVAKPGATIGTTTNATLLDRERAIELCEAGLDFIYFSVDGANKETYEEIRVGANFEKVIENISGMLEVAKEYRPEIRTMFNFVIQPENLKQIPDIAEIAADLGINGITYSYAQEPDIDELNPFGAEALNNFFAEARKRVAGKSIFLGFPPVREVKGAHCSFLECVCMLRDGRVLPCHAMAPGYCAPECSRDFGSLTEHSLSEVWNSPEFTKYRDDVLHERYPSNCQGCYCLKYLVP